MDLTDQQWQIVETILPPDRVRADRRGRPWTDRRRTLNGILWILRTGAPWKDLPERYGAYQTVHRRFQNWVRSKVLEQVLLAVAQDLKDRGGLDLSEAFVDGSFAPAKKGGSVWERLNVERAPRSWQLQTAMVFLSPYAQTVLVRLK
jgi:transposase